MAVTVMTTDVQVGKKEDVSDIITIISPTATPFITLSGSESAHNILVQWQEDVLDPPADNAQVEGAVAPSAHLVPTVMRQNVTQIYAKTVSVSGSADAVKLYGTKREFARQMQKKGKEIKRDLEWSLVNTRQTMVNAAAGSARRMAGVQAQFDATMVVDASNGVAAPYVNVLSEAHILYASQLCYNNGGEPNKLICSSSNATVIADMGGSSGRYRNLEETKKIVNAVDVYVTPFGIELTVVIDRWINPIDVLIVDPAMWKLRPLRPWFTKDLAEVGDATQKELLGEYSLQHSSFIADALITNLKVPAAGGNT